MVLTQYLSDRFPDTGLLPSNNEDRATMRLFTELCGSSLPYFPIVRASAAAAKDGDTEELEQAIEAFKQGLCNVNTFLDKMGNGGPFLFGEQFSLAECNIAPFLQRACIVLPSCTSVDPIKMCEEHNLIHAKAWIESVIARTSVKAAELSNEELMRGINRILERLASTK
mmetsp:Transcript_28970/g.40709  ORF Transcript_28970/g.40709 Transcript_28970/m.40709 type:complete len:169 (-) Transcript_28970:173-679(-)